MENLQTKPLIPEWVKKLAEALDEEYLLTFKYESEELTLETLAEFIWEQIVKDVIPNDLPS